MPAQSSMRDMSEVLRSAFRRTFKTRRLVVRRGTLEHIDVFESDILGNSRKVTVYLPPGYSESGTRRYPVLYMQDGQNLFEPERAFIPGQHWRLKEAADAAIGSRTLEPLIIIGIDHAGENRVHEYTPTLDPVRQVGGRANLYARMLIEELRPLIDTTYRTLTDREHTGIGGSSLGGLVSLFVALRFADVFGRAVIMSPSVWWGGRAILRHFDQRRAEDLPRIWLDIGGREGRETLGDVRLLRDRMLARGWNNTNFKYYEDRRGDHSERAWASRVRLALEFLLPTA